MRRLFVHAVLAAAVVAAAVPGRAEVFAVGGLADSACAGFYQEAEGGLLIAEVCAANSSSFDTYEGPASGPAACAAVSFVPEEEDPGNPLLVDVGCGALDIEVDPLLGTGTIYGVLTSEVQNLTTGEVVGASTISIDVTLTAYGPPLAGAGHFAEAYTYPYVTAGGGAFVGREAAPAGVVVSAELGAPVPTQSYGLLERGTGFFIDAYA